MCNCINIQMGSYQNQTVINPPFPVNDTMITKPTGIDNCILEEILTLWETGIETSESCCGHNIAPAYIMVPEKSVSKMLEAGYLQYPEQPLMFHAKSC